MKIPFAFTFDDLLLVPQYSEVLPTEVDTTGFLTSKIKLKEPIVATPMDTVTESGMAIAMAAMGALGVLHKNMSVEKQVEEVLKVKSCKVTKPDKASLDSKGRLLVAAAVGASGDFLERAGVLVKAGADVVVVDTAHGHTKRVLEAVKAIKIKQKTQVVGGNVATYEGAKALIAAGADAIKVGIGPGSICTTRMVSGCGVPQVYAVQEAARAARPRKIPVIADGGIKYSGDITKVLAAGASCVMVGSLLAGTDEAPGEVFDDGGKKYKYYRGMGSLGAMNEGSKDRYGQEKIVGGKLVPEGVEARVPYKGSVAQIIEQLTGGLRSGMGYCGAKDIAELQKKAKFVQISPAGLRESHVHDVQVVKKAPNYSKE